MDEIQKLVHAMITGFNAFAACYQPVKQETQATPARQPRQKPQVLANGSLACPVHSVELRISKFDENVQYCPKS